MEKIGGRNVNEPHSTDFAYINKAATNDDGRMSPCMDGNVPVEQSPPSLQVQPYNPYDNVDTSKGNSFWGTIFNIVILCGGPCIFTMPITFVNAGYVPGLLSAFLLVALYAYIIRMISWCEHQLCIVDRVPTYSYSKMVFVAFRKGPRAVQPLAGTARWISYACFVFVWFGYACYAYIIAAQNMRLVFNALRLFDGQLTFYTTLELPFVPLLLLAWVPKLKYLVPVSTIGNACNFASLAIIVYYVIVDESPWRWIGPFTDVSHLPLVMGSVLFTINGTGIMLSLKHEMKEPRRFDSADGVLVTSFGFLAFVYAAVSLLCALKYGDLTLSSVIQNLPLDEWPAQMAVTCSSIALFAQYPFCIFIPFDIVWTDMMKMKRKSLRDAFPWDYVMRTGLVVISFVISYLVTNVLVFVSLCGTVGTSIDSLILPAMTHSFVMWSRNEKGDDGGCGGGVYRWHLCKNALIVVFALMLVVTGVDDCFK